MATPQQKAFCFMQFAKTNSVIMVQQQFRTHFGIHPPVRCNKLLLLTCPYTVGLLGHQTPPLIFFLWGYVKELSTYRPPLPHDLQQLKAMDHHSSNSHGGRLAGETMAGFGLST
jgi:hypothetical protein